MADFPFLPELSNFGSPPAEPVVYPFIIISGIHRDEEGENIPNIGCELLDEVERIGKKIPLIFYTPDITLIDKTKLSRAYGAADALNELIKLAINALAKV